MLRWHNVMEESSMMKLEEFQWIWISSKVETLWRILQRKAEYMTAIVAAKEVICVKKFVCQTRCSSKWANTMKIYCTTIESTCFELKGLRSHRRTKLYNAISLENEWCVATQRNANSNGPEVSDLVIRFTTSNAYG